MKSEPKSVPNPELPYSTNYDYTKFSLDMASGLHNSVNGKNVEERKIIWQKLTNTNAFLKTKLNRIIHKKL